MATTNHIGASHPLEQAIYSSAENNIVVGDSERIAQAISNLLDNATKFTKEGSISIKVEKEDNENNGDVTISVKDTGMGIDSEILPRLFSKFATKSFKGTGLGLFISKSIIEAHGGRIWADNNPDKGATFSNAKK
jgi:two-component system, OmpR family, sensor histidine kinase VicK